AITPRPDWGTPANNGTPVSTTMPTSPTSLGAMPFASWTNFGTDFLVTSTVNQWISCTPGTGSLLTVTAGTITCQLEKVVATACNNVVPNRVSNFNPGPALTVNGNTNFFYLFDGSTAANWPTHDPCGGNQQRQLTGVANPGGAVYVRPAGS